jgi:shikimate dehydrogenase
MRFCYLIGYPVEHSVSPKMQNAAFKYYNIAVDYKLAKVKPDNLSNFLKKHTEDSVLGFNITIPHKVAVLRYLDEVDTIALSIGAVNTVKNIGGHLRGYNTDGVGGVCALEKYYGDLKGSRVLILGSGGAARALAYTLSEKVESLYILNRTAQKAEELSTKLKEKGNSRVIGEGFEALKNRINQVDIIINTTSIGMFPNVEETPVPTNLLNKDLLVYDIVYNPIQTKLLKDAKIAGSQTLSGLMMFVYQGAEAFRIWTGLQPPIDLMLRTVKSRLGG